MDVYLDNNIFSFNKLRIINLCNVVDTSGHYVYVAQYLHNKDSTRRLRIDGRIVTLPVQYKCPRHLILVTGDVTHKGNSCGIINNATENLQESLRFWLHFTVSTCICIFYRKGLNYFLRFINIVPSDFLPIYFGNLRTNHVYDTILWTMLGLKACHILAYVCMAKQTEQGSIYSVRKRVSEYINESVKKSL